MEKKAEKPATATNTKSSTASKPTETRPASSAASDVSNGDGEKVVKKLPPIKAPVGLAKGPDLKNCKSKVGSLNNIKHKPSGGKIKVETQKLKWNAKSKVGSLENKLHQPGGGNVKIFNESYVEKGKTTTTTTSNDTSADLSQTSTKKTTIKNTEANRATSAKSVTKDLKAMNLKG